ncbi:MAG: right-handed parallel beta-helix repeat-containing protein, partial [Anaplasmataceae bacterium]|nr:right-handed parallel beta-helix repeat-containing protein [Anaplasmataceae bacterium]
MKNQRKTIIRFAQRMLLLIGLGSVAMVSQAQFSGNYTIDNTTAASGTNFNNWVSFANSLQGLARTDGGPALTSGVSGPVVVTVVASTVTAETSPVIFPAITGMSATNTVTIDGGNFTYWYSGSNAAIRFTGGDYFTIKNLTIHNSNATPGGIWFNNQSDYNTVTGCNIYFSALTSSNSSTYYVSMSTNVTSPTSNGSSATGTNGQPGSYNSITNCKMYTQSGSPGPYYAVSLNGNTSNYSSIAQNNTFSNNVISNFNYNAVYMYYTNGNIVSNNDISRSNTTTGGQTTLYGIQTYYPYCTNRSSEISGNSFHDLPFAGATTSTSNMSSFYGMYVYYSYGNATNTFKLNGNSFKNITYTTGSRYVNYIYYCQYIDVTNNTIDNVDGSSTSSTAYDYYIYYPTAVRCNGNICTNSETKGYLYNFYLYYGTCGAYTWNEFQDNKVTNNTTVNYLYAAYLYYYNGTNSYKVNRNYIVNNNVTGTTGYFYFYLYYFQNYEVCGNVVAGNKANSKYIYIYSGLSGGYTAEIRNNTFEIDQTNCPTPSSAYGYFYNYLYYHTVWYTGNIIDFRGQAVNGTNPYYRYIYMYLSYATPSNLKEFDHNTFYLNNNFQYPYWYFNGTNYTDWSGFSGSGSAGPNDNGLDPKFIDKANNDWRAGAWFAQNGIPYKPINFKDANQVNRNTTRHDRGGLETNTNLKAIATNFSVPAVVCAGYTTSTTTLTVQSDYLYDLATNFNCSYSVNGGPKISQKVTKKLAQGDTVTVTFNKSLMLNEVGVNRVAIYVDLPDDDNSDDSFIFTTFVKPAPGGGKYVASTKPTQAVYQYTKANDVTILGQKVIYNSVAPRIYSNATYGTDWTGSAYAITAGGNMRPFGEAKFTAPSGGNDLEVYFSTTDKNMEDTIIWVCLKITDLNNGCDTTIKRQVLIYPTVVPKFTFPAVNCDGDNVLFENKSTVRSGSMEFLWDFGTGKVADQTETPEPYFTFPTSGSYKVKLIAKTLPYGFPSEDSATITIRNKPTTVFNYTNACEGANLTFSSAGTTPTAS